MRILRLNSIGSWGGLFLWLVASVAPGTSESGTDVASLYEDAVRFQLSHDARQLVADHYRSLNAQGAEQAEIDVEPRLIEVSGEPWLASVAVVVRIPQGRVTPATLRNLLLASYSSQGFAVNGETNGSTPRADIQITTLSPLKAHPQTPTDWTRVAYLIAFGIGIACLCLGLYWQLRRRRTTRIGAEPQAVRCVAESLLSFQGSWDLRALLDAPPAELRHLFRSLPLQEALQILSQLEPPARHKVLDELRIQTAVRRRIEERLQLIYAKA